MVAITPKSSAVSLATIHGDSCCCSSGTMANWRRPLSKNCLSILSGIVSESSIECHRNVQDACFSHYARTNALKISHTLETGSAPSLAESYRKSGDNRSASQLVEHATDDHPGCDPLLRFHQTVNPEGLIDWIEVVLPSHLPYHEAN